MTKFGHLTQFARRSFSLAPHSNLHWPHIRTKTCSICQILWNKLPRRKQISSSNSFILFLVFKYFIFQFKLSIYREWNLFVRDGAHLGLQISLQHKSSRKKEEKWRRKKEKKGEKVLTLVCRSLSNINLWIDFQSGRFQIDARQPLISSICHSFQFLHDFLILSFISQLVGSDGF